MPSKIISATLAALIAASTGIAPICGATQMAAQLNDRSRLRTLEQRDALHAIRAHEGAHDTHAVQFDALTACGVEL